jgi:hypothetical protein
MQWNTVSSSFLGQEMPGAPPEIAPSPEFDPFVDFRERAIFMLALSSYGVQWPVIHHFAGVRSDIQDSWPVLSVSRLRVENGQIDVDARKADKRYTTRVSAPEGWNLIIGHTSPAGTRVRQVMLDGHTVSNY